jgi:hypothetical protein
MKALRSASLRLALALSLAAVALHSGVARSVLEAGAGTVWNYLDEGEPGAGWREAGFDDPKWKSGKAPLGFGETRLGTQFQKKPLTAWFRREFDAPELKAGEGLVILLCMDDGAIVYLNGKELGRANLPKGRVTASTTALRDIADRDEGSYLRLRVPAKALRAGRKNVLAVEVHNAAATNDDLFFDLSLKTLPPEFVPEVSAGAREIVSTFNKEHYIGPGVRIPDGYLDGGRRMEIDAGRRATSGREILFVDRTQDTELANDLAFACSPELRSLPTLERVQRLAAWIDRETTPSGGARWVAPATEQLQRELTGKAVLIGDWMDQCQAGVCRHRSLLFKILADEAGLKAALVRGNYARSGPPGFAHAWNEVVLDDGQRVLVDVMHNGAKPKFPEVTDPEVIRHYLKVDGTPWYGGKSDKSSPTTPISSPPRAGRQ